MPRARRLPFLPLLSAALIALMASLSPAKAADMDRLEAYLEITGFDVALESIRLSADSAPAMLGVEAEAFGSEWSRLVNEVFATPIMHDMALDILSETLSDELLTHAADFYASALGKRLVVAENRSHMVEEEGLKSESGAQIIEGLTRLDSPRLDILTQLIEATDSTGGAVRAIQEIQVRFLMAAAAAGVVELRMDEADLRAAMRAQEGEMRASIARGALSNAAYTYQAFSNEEVQIYADALEHPQMQEVYALMNAVQYEIMANRFEAVAARLADMKPSQDL